MCLSPWQVHQDLLLHARPRPDTLRVAHQGDGLATDVLTGKCCLRAELPWTVQPCHGDYVHTVLTGPLRGRHLRGLRPVPIRRMQQHLAAGQRQAPGDLRQPDLVPEHQGHAAEAGHSVDGGERIPGGGPATLGGADVRLAVLGDDAVRAHEVGAVEVRAALACLHQAEAQVHRLLLGAREHELEDGRGVLGSGFRVERHFPPLEAPELGQHSQLRASSLGIDHLPLHHPLRALASVGAAELHHRHLQDLGPACGKLCGSRAVHGGARHLLQGLREDAVELRPSHGEEVVRPSRLLALGLKGSHLRNDHVLLLFRCNNPPALGVAHLRAAGPWPEEPHGVRVAHRVRGHVPDAVLDGAQRNVDAHLVRATAVEGVEQHLGAHEGHDAGRLRHNTIGADEEAEAAELGVEDLVRLVAGLEERVLVVPQDVLPVHPLDLTVRPDEQRRYVHSRLCLAPQVHSHGQPQAEFSACSLEAVDKVAVQSL
mmetsp:Transcript_94027/g.303735  ORF Transcript_94027/g.303735 Transcript_94027/m.303735 type:complete len:484 (+) Transcript_94027:313-1764(+)